MGLSKVGIPSSILSGMFVAGLLLGGIMVNAAAQPTPQAHLDHFICYSYNTNGRFTKPKPPGFTVTLTDQFTGAKGFSIFVGSPALLCTPVLRKIVIKGQPHSVAGNQDHLECYAFDGGSRPSKVVTLTNQFGQTPDIELSISRLLCVPTSKSKVHSP